MAKNPFKLHLNTVKETNYNASMATYNWPNKNPRNKK